MRLAARFIATMVVVFVMVAALHANTETETPKIEWSLGYSFWRAMPTATSNRMGYLHGGSTSAAYNFTRNLGLVVDFGGYANSRITLMTPTGDQTFDSNGSAYSYMLGPNRRVDISLNTTGQQSTRLYPFNAKDSMTLLSEKGSESKTRTPPATVKKISQR